MANSFRKVISILAAEHIELSRGIYLADTLIIDKIKRVGEGITFA